MTPEILRRLLSLLSADRAFAPLSRLTFGSTGPILIFHEVQEDPDNELRAGSSPEFLDGLVRGLIASGWISSRWMRRSDASGRGRFIVVTFDDGYREARQKWSRLALMSSDASPVREPRLSRPGTPLRGRGQ
jgi:hypothetical protein